MLCGKKWFFLMNTLVVCFVTWTENVDIIKNEFVHIQGSPIKPNLQKHVEHGGISFFSASEIWWWNLNSFHLTDIIFIFYWVSGIEFADIFYFWFSCCNNRCIALNIMWIVILGRGQMNSLLPLKKYQKARRSFQAIISGLHLKLLRKISSAFSASCEEYLSLLGLLNILNMFCSGEMRNVFSFAGPGMKIFWFLPLSFIIRSQRASANLIGCS